MPGGILNNDNNGGDVRLSWYFGVYMECVK